MKKRILQFIGSFHQGGSERQATELARALKTEGSHDIFVATLTNEGILLKEMHDSGFTKIPEFPLTSFFSANFVTQLRRCAAYMRENTIDLVHTHDFYTNVFGMAAASLAGVEARIASKRETAGMRSSRQEFVEKLAFGRAQRIVANSAAVREHLIERGISPNKINIIYNGLDLSRFDKAKPDAASIRAALGLPTDENMRFVMLVANLRHTVKNVPMFLRVAKRVGEAVPNTHFIIAGEGELETELKAMSVELAVDKKVHFIGRCSDVPALLSTSFGCVLTSTAEGFSNSILEYMAAGKPVVATHVGGAAEAIVEGETGYLVESGDDTAMAERLIDLLNDDAKISVFGTTAKQIVAAKFSQDTQLRNTLELYNSLLYK